MTAKKILFITQEINPYVPESPLTVLGRKIPLGAIEKGREIRAFMPKWGNINERRNQLHEVIRLSGMNLIINDTDHPLIIKVASVTGTRMQVYFIDNEDFFAKRLAECDAKGVEYKDNTERAVFYARGVLETVKKLRWVPDVIHCQGWISCIVPAYLKSAYAEEPSFRNTKVVYTPTENKLTLPTGEQFADVFEFRSAAKELFKEFGSNLTPKQLDMLAIKFADGVTFPSSTPDKDLLKYARKLKKSILKSEDNDPARYVEFFDQIWEESSEPQEEVGKKRK
mgnify:CR=1 FL=1